MVPVVGYKTTTYRKLNVYIIDVYNNLRILYIERKQ